MMQQPILHSQIIGEGFPFLILHGFLGYGDNWKTLGNQFAEVGFQVHLLDLRNHGRSFHSEQFNYQAMANDVFNYCQTKQLEEVILLGHSMGGKAAMYAACQQPELIQKLIVADIAPKAYPQHHQDILKGLSSLDFTKINTREAADKALSAYIPEIGVRQFLLKNLYWVAKGQLALRMNLPVLVNHIEEVGKALDAQAVFAKEALFLKGEKSGYITPMDELLIKKHFPKAQIQEIARAGHWLHADNPKDFLRVVSNFTN